MAEKRQLCKAIPVIKLDDTHLNFISLLAAILVFLLNIRSACLDIPDSPCLSHNKSPNKRGQTFIFYFGPRPKP